ncbi:MAG TPA: sigma-70 family RNA polymerase sigma factor, partial [Candidatus Angelobacter sp.]
VNAKADEVLAHDLQTGDADALTVLFERYSGAVFAIAHEVLRDRAEAEEVVQQVFLEVYEAIRQFDYDKGGFRPWLLKKAEFRAIDQRRRLKVQGIYNWVNIDDQEDQQESTEAVFHLSREEISYLVRDLLRVLNPRQLRVIKLSFFQGLTLQEVGTETKETPSAVRRLFYGGLRKLRVAVLGKENGKKASSPGKEVTTKEKLDVSA